ncbi:MAG: acetate kinase [Coleofasciculaceae cyanobacterium SM2_3_26]|nr:acetate kinase [Coleofasciculaceae cyanobacterium SM2_3_26]
MMGTRSGSVDPGILIHLMRESDLSADDLDRMLNRASGLQGISGISNDMRQIFAEIESGSDRAQLALDIFVHRLRSHMGAMLASLGGLDALVFTAGIGEHSPPIRALACEAFEFLGVKLDPARNEASPVDEDITFPNAKVRVLTIKAREEWAIAEDCWRLTTQ